MQADPVEVEFAQLAQERGELVLTIEVGAVARDVLRDDDQLLHPGVCQLARLGEDILHAAAAVLAAQVGDDAESAAVVAALGDAEVGIVAGRGEHAVKLLDGTVDVGEAARALPGHQLAQGGDDVAVAAGSHHAVDLRELVDDLLLIALGETSRDEDLAEPAVRLELRHRQNGVDGLGLRAVNEAAGVDDHGVGALGLLLQLDPRLAAQGHHLLGVDQILGAAKGNE